MSKINIVVLPIGNPKAMVTWINAIATEAQKTMIFYGLPIMERPINIEVEFYFPPPPSGKFQKFHMNQPDIIHLPKCLEALRGIAISKEAIIQEIIIRKKYSKEGRAMCYIKIEELK